MQKQTTQHLYQNCMDSASEKKARNVFANCKLGQTSCRSVPTSQESFLLLILSSALPEQYSKSFACFMSDGQLLWSLICEKWRLQCAMLARECESQSYSWMADPSASLLAPTKQTRCVQKTNCLNKMTWLCIHHGPLRPTSDPVWSHHQNHTLWGNPCTTMESLNL